MAIWQLPGCIPEGSFSPVNSRQAVVDMFATQTLKYVMTHLMTYYQIYNIDASHVMLNVFSVFFS